MSDYTVVKAVSDTMLQILKNVGISRWFPTDHIFPEEDRMFSATLRAVRYATQLAAQSGRGTGADDGQNGMHAGSRLPSRHSHWRYEGWHR